MGSGRELFKCLLIVRVCMKTVDIFWGECDGIRFDFREIGRIVSEIRIRKEKTSIVVCISCCMLVWDKGMWYVIAGVGFIMIGAQVLHVGGMFEMKGKDRRERKKSGGTMS